MTHRLCLATARFSRDGERGEWRLYVVNVHSVPHQEDDGTRLQHKCTCLRGRLRVCVNKYVVVGGGCVGEGTDGHAACDRAGD